MYEYYPYRKKTKRKNEVVEQPRVVQYKKYHFYANAGLTKKIEDFKEEMRQGDSKVFQDILNDFFLDREIIENKKDIEHLLGE